MAINVWTNLKTEVIVRFVTKVVQLGYQHAESGCASAAGLGNRGVCRTSVIQRVN